ncbi:MAG: two-component system C4-dicarboxylate transport sensor histidine kinase DctB, partial [Oceanospirillaceae bacterium]
NQLVGAEVNLVELAAKTSVKNARETIKSGRIWLVAMVGISLLFSGLIIWLYVGRNMVARITQLDSSMRSIANGNLNQQVPVKGRDEIGAMARSLVSFRDQLSTLQEELVQAGKLAALGQLSAGIAHEINQPLSAVGHYAHNGLRLIDAQRYSETADNLRQISSLTKRATTIITRLKSMGREQSSALVVVDLSTVINNVLAMLEGDKVRQVTDIEVELAAADIQVMAEPIQLEQVVLNLVTNALDAVAQSEQKRIKISAVTINDSIEIYIADSGIGIDEQSRKQIFDPFFTTKRRSQNLGLGLSISFNIIQNFGGKLSLNTPAQGGACFCIALPKRGRL